MSIFVQVNSADSRKTNFQHCHRAIADDACLEVGFYAVRAVTHLVLHAGTDQLKAFQNLVLPVIGLVERLLAAGQEEKVF